MEPDKQYELIDGIWKEVKKPLPVDSDGWDGHHESSFAPRTDKHKVTASCPYCGSKHLIDKVTEGKWFCRGCFRDVPKWLSSMLNRKSK